MPKMTGLMVAAVAAVLFLMGCDREPIRVGFSGQLTGMYSDLGVNGRNGAQLAVEDVNAGGGVDGRRLELVVRDDLGAAEGARAADKELAEGGVVAIVGHMTSGQSVAAMEYIRRAGVVLLSPTTSTPELTGVKDLFFRVQPSTDLAAQMLARYMVEKRSITRCSTIRDTDNDAYSEPFNRFFVQAFARLGGTIVSQHVFSSLRGPDWDSLLDGILAGRPQGLMMMISAREAAVFVQALRRRDKDLPLFSSGWAHTGALFEFGGKAVEGIVFSVLSYSGEEGPELELFRKRYRERFGKLPSFAAAQSYDAVRVLVRALELTGGKAEGLPEALVRTKGFPGLQGEISLDEFGDTRRPVYITESRDGGFAILERISDK